MKLYLIRHGQSEANLRQIYAGQMDVALTAQGREEALRLRPLLSGIPFDRVYSSDLIRALETQRIALPETEAEQTPLLREYDVGALTGLTFAEISEQFPPEVRRRWDFSSLGGESRNQILSRLREFLSLLEESPCDNVIAFSHNGLIRCMLEVALGAPIDFSAVRSDNCSVHVFAFDGHRWQLLAWNAHASFG